jgi:hypothetical protein
MKTNKDSKNSIEDNLIENDGDSDFGRPTTIIFGESEN